MIQYAETSYSITPLGTVARQTQINGGKEGSIGSYPQILISLDDSTADGADGCEKVLCNVVEEPGTKNTCRVLVAKKNPWNGIENSNQISRSINHHTTISTWTATPKDIGR
jgi:hypothetical protein